LPNPTSRERKDTPFWSALVPWVTTRATVLVVGYLAVLGIGFQVGNPLLGSPTTNLQARWDANWYLGIAMNGYGYYPSEPSGTQSVVSFPAYPISVGILARLTGGSHRDFRIAGTLLSLTAFLGALVYLIRLARDLLGNHERAVWAAWLLASYPFGVFFSAIYTESLFLLAALGAIHHTRQWEWGRAAAWGLLAGLTRPNGCLLVLPLAILAFAPRASMALAGASNGRGDKRDAGAQASRLLVVTAPAIGLAIYSAFLWRLAGDPLAWARSQHAWGRTCGDPIGVVVQQYRHIAELGLGGYATQLPHDAIGLVLLAVVVVTAWPIARRLGVAYAAFTLVGVMPSLMSGSLMSMGRFTSVLFPLFIWLAAIIPLRFAPAVAAAWLSFQAFCAVLFYTWRNFY
jgi:hypothetical protein